jgi:hypothetical protein
VISYRFVTMCRYSEVVQETPLDAPKRTLYARDKDGVLKYRADPSMRSKVGIYFDQLGRRALLRMIKHGPLGSLATDRAIDLSPLRSTHHTSKLPCQSQHQA